MNSTGTTNTVAIDSKKPNTKQELIAANIKLLIEQLEAGHSEALTNYLTAMSRFHNYSFGNVLEITSSGQAYDLQLDPNQNFAGDVFHISSLNSGTVVTEDNTPCYCPGTLIATVRGEVPASWRVYPGVGECRVAQRSRRISA